MSDEAFKTLNDFYTIGFYAWDSRAVRAVNFLASLSLASFRGRHSSEMADVDSSAEDVFKDSIDDSVTRKKVSIRLLGPRTYGEEDVLLAIFQVGESQNPLRAVFQKYKGDLLEHLWADEL